MNILRSPLPIRRKSELPPTPALPGSIQTLACRWMPLAFFEWCRHKYGDRFTLYPLDMQPVVFLSHPADIRAALNAPPSLLHPGAGGAAISPIVGPGSFMLQDAEEHMHGRRAIMPEFTVSAIAEHTRTVHEIVTDEVASWPLDSPFAVHPRLRSMSLRIILRTIFEEKPATLQSLHDHMLKMLDVTESFVLVEPRLRHLPIWQGIWRRFIKEREHVDREIHALIARRQAVSPGNDLLARLLATSNPDGTSMTPDQVRDSLVSVILAGHETTASEIAWALQLLAHNGAIQSRLASELDTDREDRYLLATSLRCSGIGQCSCSRSPESSSGRSRFADGPTGPRRSCLRASTFSTTIRNSTTTLTRFAPNASWPIGPQANGYRGAADESDAQVTVWQRSRCRP